MITIKNRKVLGMMMLLVIVAITAFGCSSSDSANSKGKHVTVSVADAKKLIDKGSVEVIDVRTKEEYDQGHIPSAKLLPLQELEKRLSELDAKKPYLLVCRSGNRSSQAQDILRKNNFSETYNMDKGMNEWKYDVKK